MQISGFTSSSRSVLCRRPGTSHPSLPILLTAISTGMRLSPVTVTVVPADTARTRTRTGSHELPPTWPDRQVTASSANSPGSPPGELADRQLTRLSRALLHATGPLLSIRAIPRPSQAGATVSLPACTTPGATGPIRQLTTSDSFASLGSGPNLMIRWRIYLLSQHTAHSSAGSRSSKCLAFQGGERGCRRPPPVRTRQLTCGNTPAASLASTNAVRTAGLAIGA